jgi:RDD family
MRSKMMKNVILKRLLASAVDILIALVPAFVVNPSFPTIDISWLILANLLVVCCAIPIVAQGRTPGDILLRIRPMSLRTTHLSLKNLLTRNLVYVLYLSTIASERTDPVSVSCLAVLCLSTYSIVFSNKNKYSENLTGLDLIFKTRFVDARKGRIRMKINDISSFLAKYHGFDDCVLVGIDWRDHGLMIDIQLNSIYGPDGGLRGNLDEEELVSFRCSLVQEFHLSNALNQDQVLRPEEMTWSRNIISQIRLEEGSEMLRKYDKLSIQFHHIAIRWENQDQRIDVVCSDLEFFQQTPRLLNKEPRA